MDADSTLRSPRKRAVQHFTGSPTGLRDASASPPLHNAALFYAADAMEDAGALPLNGDSDDASAWADVLHMADGIHLTNRGDIMAIPDEEQGAWITWRTLWAYTGPGFLMCIAFLDPGNLEADLQTGAYTGYQLLWVLLSATVLGLVYQSIAARIGVATGNHLADLCRLHYQKPAAMCLWVMTELAIIGSDIQEVLGSAIALQILLGVPLWAGCIITAIDTFTFLFMHVFGVRKLEGLFVFLVLVMTVSFFINYFKEPPPAAAILGGLLLPKVHSYAAIPALGLVGAVIMPHNLYLHSALVLSRAIDRLNPKKVWEGIKYYTIDSALALTVAFFINLAVVCTFAVQFFDPVCATQSTLSACLSGDAIDTNEAIYGVCNGGEGVCQQIGLSHAGEALHGALGKAAKYVWAVGLLAAGQSSTMTGTYAGQFVFEGFLHLKIPQWQRLFLTRGIALGPALLVTIALRSDDTATDRVTEWLNVLQSVQLPFALIPLLHFAGSAAVMGRFRIGRRLKACAWTFAVFIIGVNCFIVLSYLEEDASNVMPLPAFYLAASTAATAYICFCLYLMWADVSEFLAWLRSLGRRAAAGPLAPAGGGGAGSGGSSTPVPYVALQSTTSHGGRHIADSSGSSGAAGKLGARLNGNGSGSRGPAVSSFVSAEDGGGDLSPLTDSHRSAQEEAAAAPNGVCTSSFL